MVEEQIVLKLTYLKGCKKGENVIESKIVKHSSVAKEYDEYLRTRRDQWHYQLFPFLSPQMVLFPLCLPGAPARCLQCGSKSVCVLPACGRMVVAVVQQHHSEEQQIQVIQGTHLRECTVEGALVQD